MVNRLRDSRGFALLLAVMVIGLLVAITLEFNAAMRDELIASANVHDGITLKSTARSGVALAMAALKEHAAADGADSLLDDWADKDLMSSLLSSLCIDGGGELTIIDASRKININRLVDESGVVNLRYTQLLRRFLSFGDFRLGSEEIEDILDAVTDWLDPDDEVTHFGAENSYYMSLEKPYSCRNGPMGSIEELLLVKGITPEIFYGTDDNAGIGKFLTVHGDGKVNINTAPPVVLWSLSDRMDFEMALDMASYREDENNDIQSTSWYKQVAGMADFSLDPDVVTVVSSHFEISSEGVKGQMRRGVSVVLEKSEKQLKIISWKVE
ncbi:MAG TPA: general secretion pathway protein GspK [Desulfobacteraceae bacterium]|jgi:general secretion pathway protein K|nr:general secretion pathway protein GspK [Desulfobacteraceae bacterium]